MRYINRGPEPKFWTNYKQNHRGAVYRDLNLSEEGERARRDMRSYLVKSQHGLCGYCCSRIDERREKSLIEHIKPQSRFPQESMDYGNIIASCTKSETCGSNKEDVHEPKLVSPLQPDCAEHFRYLPTGKIEGLTERGQKTIDLLQLNKYRLCEARRALLLQLDWADERYVREVLLTPDSDGNLEQFADMLEQFCDDDFFLGGSN